MRHGPTVASTGRGYFAGAYERTQPAAERHLRQQRQPGARLPRQAGVRLGPGPGRHPGVVGSRRPHRRHRRPLRGGGIRRAGSRPVRRKGRPRRRRGRRAHAAAARRPGRARSRRRRRLPARRRLGHRSKVGAVGFCMGGGFVLQLAAQQGDKIGAAVPFYGVGPAVPDQYSGITAPVQGHYAEEDGFYPVDQAREQEQQMQRADRIRGRVLLLPGRVTPSTTTRTSWAPTTSSRPGRRGSARSSS